MLQESFFRLKNGKLATDQDAENYIKLVNPNSNGYLKIEDMEAFTKRALEARSMNQ
jgi:hypothetical protein